jgi:hypothetical protein
METERIGGFAGVLAAAAMAASATAATHERSQAAAVIAEDEAWARAEQRGDAAFVDGLLLPGYRSVAADGRVHDKATIVEATRRNAGSQAMAMRVAAWNAAHPSKIDVLIGGDTAILTFAPTSAGASARVFSSDVFARVNGRWRPIYSQHSSAEVP